MNRSREDREADGLPAAERAVKAARRGGADEAEAFVQSGRGVRVRVQDGRVELVKPSVGRGLGLRVFCGTRMGFAHTNDLSTRSLETTVHRAVAMARLSDPDSCNGLIPPARGGIPDVHVYDSRVADLSPGDAVRIAAVLEETTREVDSRIVGTEGADLSSRVETVTMVTSLGSAVSYRHTAIRVSIAPIASQGGDRRAVPWMCERRFLNELASPEDAAAAAATRAIRLLGARRMRTTSAPIILEPPAGRDVLSCLLRAVNGDRVNRGVSFLAGRRGETIASDEVSIFDDGRLSGLPGSRPVDDEGIPTARLCVIARGVLQAYLYDVRAARRAGVPPSGHAVRDYRSLPSIGPNQFYLEKGTMRPDQIMALTGRGLLVTGVIGLRYDAVTGSLSFGAEGLWIEEGRPVHPVHEVVVASDLQTMLTGIDAVGSDLDFIGTVACPTFRVREVTLAGR